MIKTLSISNFKGIKKLTLNLKKINIFVGRNNTGKSTILDSILTLFYPYTNNLISKISYPLTYNLYQGTTEATIKAIFHPRQSKITDFAHMDSGKPSEYILTIISEKQKIQNIIAFNEHIAQFKKNRVSELITREFYRFPEKFKSIDETKNLDSNNELSELIGQRKVQLYEEIEESIMKNLVFQWTYPEGTFFGIPNSDNIKGIYRIRPNIFVVPNFPFNNDTFEYISIYKNEQVIEKYRELFKKNSLNTILQTIKQNIADFVDINEIDNELIVSYGQKENPLKLPLKLMGEGFQSLIKMIFTFAQKDKIFLLEEPENCLHKGYNEYLTKIILQNIQTNQFIITTHNLEFLKSIIEQVKNSNLQDIFQIIRMHNIEGEIDCEILDFSEVEKEINDLEIDLRGY